ncbi:MAG: hypothetical protein ACE363_09485 [Alphaproteobacteria bacterium]
MIDLDLKPYPEWEAVALADPRSATPAQFIDGFLKICATEAPILEDRLYALYARAANLGRVYGPVRSRFERALDEARRSKQLTVTVDQFGAHEENVVTVPGEPLIVVRTRGSRSLHEIPGPEIAEIMLSIRIEHDLIGKEELFRMVLDTYELKRLTKATEERLTDVLTTWIA